MIYHGLYISLCGSQEGGGLLLVVEAVETRLLSGSVGGYALQDAGPGADGCAALLLSLADAFGLLALLSFAACAFLCFPACPGFALAGFLGFAACAFLGALCAGVCCAACGAVLVLFFQGLKF